jgi:hypothetical protein
MPKHIKSEQEIKVGDFYEDCAFHPCLCISVGADGDEDGVEGISLVNGSGPRGCSARHCGLRLLTLEEAIRWKFHGPIDQKLDPKDQWWSNQQ